MTHRMADPILKRRYSVVIYLIVVSGIMSGCTAPLMMTVVHINDSHSHLDPVPLSIRIDSEKIRLASGGAARLSTRIQDIRSEVDNVAFLHAGDAVQGTLYFTKYHGEPEIEWLNWMDCDAMVTGNHEYDKGGAVLAEMIDRAAFPVLAANVDVTSDPNLRDRLLPYIILDMDGRDVAVIGLVSPETPITSNPEDTIIFRDCAAAVSPIIDRLTQKGINIIILLTHIGYENDIALAQSVEGVDVIVGGHTHTWLGDTDTIITGTDGPYPTRVTSPSGQPVYIIHAGAHGRSVGRLDMTVDRHGIITRCSGSAPVLVDSTWNRYAEAGHRSQMMDIVEEDPVIQRRLAPYREGIKTLKNQVIAHVERDIRHVRLPGMRHPSTGETLTLGSELAPLMAKAMFQKADATGLKPDFAVQNAGGVRMDLPAGNVTVGDVYELLPFENTLVVVDLTGADIRACLESLMDRLQDPDNDGCYPYWHRLRFDTETDPSSGHRIRRIDWQTPDKNWQPLDPDRIYRIATNSYLADGRDGYALFKAAARKQYDTGFLDAEIFTEALQNEWLTH